MEDWWRLAHDIILGAKLTQTDIEDMVKETLLHFREGLQDFIHLLNQKNILMTVFSAGLQGISFLT